VTSSTQDDLPETFADALRAALARRSMTQARLASSIGVSKNTVTSWARGVHEPGLAHVRQIAMTLDMSVAELLGEHAPSAPEVDDLVRRLATVAPDLMTVLEEAQRRAAR
jgi:transcriptional regulator with XRE-family HTH domain